MASNLVSRVPESPCRLTRIKFVAEMKPEITSAKDRRAEAPSEFAELWAPNRTDGDGRRCYLPGSTFQVFSSRTTGITDKAVIGHPFAPFAEMTIMTPRSLGTSGPRSFSDCRSTFVQKLVQTLHP
jgi:hypothetical protein